MGKMTILIVYSLITLDTKKGSYEVSCDVLVLSFCFLKVKLTMTDHYRSQTRSRG